MEKQKCCQNILIIRKGLYCKISYRVTYTLIFMEFTFFFFIPSLCLSGSLNDCDYQRVTHFSFLLLPEFEMIQKLIMIEDCLKWHNYLTVNQIVTIGCYMLAACLEDKKYLVALDKDETNCSQEPCANLRKEKLQNIKVQ